MTDTIEDIETDLFLEALFRRYGYDFRDYARASTARRIDKACQIERVTTVSALQDRLLRDPQAMARFTDVMSVNVTSMFRDPDFFRAFRRHTLPALQTYPFLRVWVAGCSTGEEAYSVAILLHEAGLLERSRIYATDFSDNNLQHAKQGVYPLKKMQDYTRNYQSSGGTEDFSNYYSAQYEQAKFRSWLSKNISFAQHNLTSDASFNEFHVIFCRNVLIYFEQSLQEQVMHLLNDSLAPLGFLCLGTHESIYPTSFRDQFNEVLDGTRLFRATG